GVFDHARFCAALAEEGGLLVAGNSCDWDGGAEEICISVNFAGGFYFGKDRAGDLQEFEEFVIPIAGGDVVEHGAGGVAGVGDVEGAAGEVPDEPGIDGAEGELAGGGLG